MAEALNKAIAEYAGEVRRLAGGSTTNEATYYPAIRNLLAALLRAQNLPFEVRTNTSERREESGVDQPDLAFYDGGGDFVVLLGEVKEPGAEIEQMAVSTDRNDQIGRYLAQTRAVLLCNVRAFGLLTVSPSWTGTGPVPPEHRRLEQVVELWSSAFRLREGPLAPVQAVDQLAELLEWAVTRYASIADPESLARILARQARRAKEDLPAEFTSAVQNLLDDFANALGVTFEGPDGQEFLRSSLIQTAFYGLFAGWALWWYLRSAAHFHWRDLAGYLKIPFLAGLFHEFQNPTRLRELGLARHLDAATETLARVDTERFFARFTLPSVMPANTDGGSTATAAILYFYEPFLEAFDPELRKELGVWYTPAEIVRYQVRRIDQLLRSELGCNRGLADERVVVLDPCCGTGAYLVEVLRCVAEQLHREGAGDLLGSKLLDAVCRRIVGFEILTAPFVIAQLQVFLILAELGVAPDAEHRPAIFLTNALTGWQGSDQLKLHFPELQAEHDAARRVKREEKIIVVLGNPPYNRWAGVPIDEEAHLADHYKGIRRNARGKQVGSSELFTQWGIRKHLLNDLYIRFFRLAEERIGGNAEFGVVSFISNSSFLNGRSHPIMRQSLLHNFNSIWIDNLHGNRLASERTPQGESCETIFSTQEGGAGIKVGTSISTLVKRRSQPDAQCQTKVYTRDFWGSASAKRNSLLQSLQMAEWPTEQQVMAAQRAEGPREYQQFVPTQARRWKLVSYEAAGSFEDWPSLDELFPTAFQGVNHNRGLEGALIETDRPVLTARIREYYSDLSFDEFRMRHPVLCQVRAEYEPASMRALLRERSGYSDNQVVPYLVFPLDQRWIYYETQGKLLNRRRPELWDNLSDNEFLVTVPQPRRVSESLPMLATTLFDLHLHDRGSVGFPVRVLPEAVDMNLFTDSANRAGEPRSNLANSVWEKLKALWGLSDDRYGPAAAEIVRSLFRLTLAICHAPQYEADHRDSLAQDWAHIPIPKDKASLDQLAALGEQVVVLLNPAADASAVVGALLGSDAPTLGVIRRIGGALQPSDLVVSYSYYASAAGRWVSRAPHPPETLRPCWGETTADLYLNETVYLAHVPEKVWRYELGGYPVIKKWLGYRDRGRAQGRPLTLAETDHLRSMVQRIAALLVLHEKLDTAYDQAAQDAFTAEELGL